MVTPGPGDPGHAGAHLTPLGPLDMLDFRRRAGLSAEDRDLA